MEQMSRRAHLAFLLTVVFAFTGGFERAALAQPSPPAKTETDKGKVAAATAAGDKAADAAAATAEKGDKAKNDVAFTIENSLSLRDPFRRPSPANGLADSTIPDLERFELDKLRLVGVITGPKKAKALIATPSGKMHIVAEDARLGSRHGILKKIAPGMIEVEEKVVNLLGQEENIETVIEFKEKNDDKEKKDADK